MSAPVESRPCGLCLREFTFRIPPNLDAIEAGEAHGHRFTNEFPRLTPGTSQERSAWECRTCVNAPPDERTALLVAAALRP